MCTFAIFQKKCDFNLRKHVGEKKEEKKKELDRLISTISVL